MKMQTPMVMMTQEQIHQISMEMVYQIILIWIQITMVFRIIQKQAGQMILMEMVW